MRSIWYLIFLGVCGLQCVNAQENTGDLIKTAEKQMENGDIADAKATLERCRGLMSSNPSQSSSPTTSDSKKVASPSADKPDDDDTGKKALEWLTLQRAPAGGTTTGVQPASFSYLDDLNKGSSSAFNADFYIQAQANISGDTTHTSTNDAYISNVTSAQGSVTSAQNKANKFWKFSEGLTVQNSFGIGKDTFTSVSLVDNSNQTFTLNKLEGEVQFTANYFECAIGQYQPAKPRLYEFTWRPYLGLDAGAPVASSQKLTKDQATALDLFERTTATLDLLFLDDFFKIKDPDAGFSLFADDTIHSLPLTGNFHNILATGADLMFTKNVGLTLTFKVGQDAPSYVYGKTLQAALGVQY